MPKAIWNAHKSTLLVPGIYLVYTPFRTMLAIQEIFLFIAGTYLCGLDLIYASYTPVIYLLFTRCMFAEAYRFIGMSQVYTSLMPIRICLVQLNRIAALIRIPI